MRTIGRHWKYEPGATRKALCDVCGAAFPRCELRRNADGLLVCADDDQGRCNTELMRDLASYQPPTRPVDEGGAVPSKEAAPTPVVHPLKPGTPTNFPGF